AVAGPARLAAGAEAAERAAAAEVGLERHLADEVGALGDADLDGDGAADRGDRVVRKPDKAVAVDLPPRRRVLEDVEGQLAVARLTATPRVEALAVGGRDRDRELDRFAAGAERAPVGDGRHGDRGCLAGVEASGLGARGAAGDEEACGYSKREDTK